MENLSDKAIENICTVVIFVVGIIGTCYINYINREK